MRFQRLWDDDLIPQQLFDSSDGRGGNLDAVAENTAELDDNDLAGEQIVFRQDMPEEVRA